MARSQFPAVRDAVLSGDLDGAVLQLEKVTRILNEAIDQLGF